MAGRRPLTYNPQHHLVAWGTLGDWSVVDHLRVPAIAPGDYVLSFRFDCEQTPQIWQQCADIRIIA